MRPDLTHYVYPGIFQNQDLHHRGLEPYDNIVYWDNKVEVWTCQLDGLAECASTFKVTFWRTGACHTAWKQTWNSSVRGILRT